jgi:ATP-dependent DNA helicase RecG
MKLTTFKNHFDPWPHLEIEYVPLPETGKQIIVFHSKPSADGPYTFKGKPYLKTPSGVKSMPSEKYKTLLLEHAGLSKAWETLPAANGFSLEDLDHNEIVKTFKIGLREERIPEDEYTENPVEILTHFDLNEGDVINNAAMVLFAKKMPSDYSQCFIRMGRFIDDTMDQVIDSKQIRGNAFQLINEALDFVKRHLPISSRFDPNQIERIDELALPLLAVREAIINAICHRDYSVRAGDISLNIFNDALEIHNIGHLFGGLTVDQLFTKHPSRRRNEKIAQVFHARKLIDRFGSGTRRILRLCEEQGLPVPEFSEESDGFQVRFLFKEPIGPQKVDKTIVESLTPRQADIIEALKTHGPLSTKDLRQKIPNPLVERRLRDELNRLEEMGLISSEGATIAKKWILINR